MKNERKKVMKTNIDCTLVVKNILHTLNNVRVYAIMIVCLMTLGAGNAWGVKVLQFDFSDKTADELSEWPTATGGSATTKTYELNNEYTFALGANVYMGTYNDADYLMLKSITTLGLPAISGYKLTKVEITNSGSCSTTTRVGISSSSSSASYVSGGAYQTYSTQSDIYTYDLTSTSANTVYYIYVTNSNCQIVDLTLTYTANSKYTVTFDPGTGSCNDASLTEGAIGAGITLPSASPSAGCASDYEFMGWAKEEIDETTEEPTMYFAGNKFYPEGNCTLYAVYVADKAPTTYYEIISNRAQLQSGEDYIIEAYSGSNDYAIKAAVKSTNYIDCKDITSSISDNTTYHEATPDGDIVWTITKDDETTVSLYNSANSKYLMVNSSSPYYLGLNASKQTFTLEDEDHGESYVGTFAFKSSDKYIYFASSYTNFDRKDYSGWNIYVYKRTYSGTFNTNPVCCANAVALSYNSVGSSNVSTMTFSKTSFATCGDATSRQVTVYVTPSSGYVFESGDELTWEKTSGTIPADPTLVSGPTLNAQGKYEFVYQFAQNDNGVGKFSAAASTYTNYHTRCLTVTYAAGGGSGEGPSNHTMVNPNSKITLADNTFTAPTGKEFAGWNDGSATYDERDEYTVTASKTMTAQWSFIDYNVTYSAPSNGNYTIKVADGEASSATKTANYGQTITLAATPTTGYHFVSWTIKKTSDNTDVTGSVSLSSSSNKDATFTMPDYGVTVTATFAIDTYAITYAAGDYGSGELSGGTKSYGVAYTLSSSSNAFTRTGYSYDGWSTNADGSSKDYDLGGSYTTNAAQTFYPHWTENNYTVTFYNGSHGTVQVAGTTIADGGTASVNHFTTKTLVATESTGYTFAGWTKTGSVTIGDASAASTTILATAAGGTVTATWTAYEYTASNNLLKNGGDAHGQYTATYDATTIAINTAPTRTGYTIEGYYEESVCTNKVATATGVLQADKTYTDGSGKWVYTSAPTLYTNWTANEYDVTLDQNDATTSGSTSVTMTYNSADHAAITNPEKTGYTFNGWYTEKGASTGLVIKTDGTLSNRASYVSGGVWIRTEATTLYAKWTQSITLNTNGGSANGKVNTAIYYGAGPLTVNTVPTRTGYTVEGYYAESGCEHKVMTDAGALVDYTGWVEDGKWIHSGASTLYTKWTEETHSVTVAAGANGSASPASVSGVGITTASGDITATPNTGYHFTSWTLPDGITAASTYSATSNPIHINATADGLTITANFAVSSYDVTLNTNGGTINAGDVTSYTYGVGATLPTNVTKTGYTFDGWYDNIGLSGDAVTTISTSATGDKEFWAKWTPITYSVRFNKNDEGATGTMSNQGFTYDVAQNLTANAFSKTGYNFAGWATSAGGDVAYANSESVSNLSSTQSAVVDLFAKWTANVITITWNPNGAGATASPTSSSYTYDGGTVALATATKSLHAFDGWYTEASGGTQITEIGTTNKPLTDVEYFAHWRALTFEVKDQAGTGTADIHLTSTNGVTVYATSGCGNLITIKATNLDAIANLGGGTANKQNIQIKYLDANNGDAVVAKESSPFRLCNDGSTNYNNADGSNINLNGLTNYSQTYSISYTPSGYGHIDHYKLQLRLQNNNTNAITITFDLYGRALPEEFVVASKFGNEWYALPNTLESLEKDAKAVAGIKISVDNTTTPTKATYAPNTVVYQGEGRYASGTNVYGIRLTDGTRHLQVSTTSDKNNMWLSPTGSASCQDWWLSSSDFGYYSVTMPSNTGNESKKIGMYGGNIGYYASPTSPSGQIYFLPIEHKMVDKPASVTEWGQKSAVLEVDAQGIAGAQARIGNGDAEVATSFGQTRTSVKNGTTKYNYTVSFSTTDFSAHKGELLYIDWLDGGSNVVSTSTVEIPWIIAEDRDMYKVGETTKGPWNTEVHVLPGVTLTANTASYSPSGATINELNIYPGATVKVTTGTLDVTNLVMRNGWTRAGEKAYDVARLYVQAPVPAEEIAGANLTHTNAYSDWYIDYDQYYPVAVPFPVATSSITYKNSSNAASAGVKLRYYSGELRAAHIQQNQDDNWVEYTWGSTMPTNLEPSKGYVMTAKRPTGKAFSIVRMPLTFTNAWTALGEQGEVSETHKDQVTVTAWGVKDGSETAYAEGWNMIANPYMALHQGELTYTSGGTIEYANIPNISFTEYDQLPIETTKLKPASAFLVQAPKNGTVTFGDANRKASAPNYRREAKETTPMQKAYIVLASETAEDMMGLKISENYTADYEINADLEKLLGDAQTLKTYMRYGEMDMAYVAINMELAKDWIPVMVRIPADGEYTFSLHEASKVGELEGIYLKDYLTNEVTNLIEENYTFNAEVGTISGRFSINAIKGVRPVPTGIDIVGGTDSKEPIKFLYHDKVFILHNGVIYDATGKKVREINK